MIAHILRLGAITTLIIACTFLPFLPGRYDAFAVALSGMARVFGVSGLLLVPIGALWLIFGGGYYFAIASLVASSIIVAVVAFAGFVSLGVTLGLSVLALWIYCVSRLAPSVRALKNPTIGKFNPAPVYLLFVPTVVALFQFSLLGRAIEFSRDNAIKSSVELINDIEAYSQANGRYPTSLLALWQDYDPAVIGIERFYYEPNGDAYNLYFEQLSDQVGNREIVMYNKLDQHFFASHDSDILLWTPAQLKARRGYNTVHDASTPHWKYFWFD